MDNIKKTISNSYLFSGLPEDDLDAISDIALPVKIGKGKNIFLEGDESRGFYMIVTGKVKVFKLSLQGREKILHILGDSEPFGEAAVFGGDRFPAGATAVAATQLIFFPRREFIGLVSRKPSLALNMLGVMSARLKRFAVQIEQLSLKEVPGRLASYLVDLYREGNRAKSLKLNISKGQLAGLLGTIPETLSRILAKMSADGYLTVTGRNIDILDFSALENLAVQGKFAEKALS